MSAGTLGSSLLSAETDIVNTGLGVHSAVHFQNPANGDPSPLVINGIPHIVGQANEPLLTDNIGFEGDFRNGQSGLGGNLELLLSGIAGANNLTLNISGLTIGTDYLFQAYWEAWPTEVIDFTAEGDTIQITDQNATLITYEFTATDTVLNILVEGVVEVDSNEWLSGYSLQVVPEPGSLALIGLGGLLVLRRRRG